MPDLQDIEKYKSILNSLGGEEMVLADRAEEIEDVEPPQAGLSAEISELLEPESTGPPPVEDFGLGELGFPPEGAPEPGASALPGEELDFASLFGEEPAAPSTPGPEEAPGEPGAEPETAPEFPASVPPAAEAEDFLLSELLLPEEEIGVPEEAPPVEEPEPAAAEPFGGAEEGEPFDLSLFLGGEPGAEEGAPEGAETPAAAFEDLAFPEQEAPAPAEQPEPSEPSELSEPAAAAEEEEWELPASLDLIADEEFAPAAEPEQAGGPDETETFHAEEAVSAEELGKLMEELEAAEGAEPGGAGEPEGPGEAIDLEEAFDLEEVAGPAEPEAPEGAFEFPDIEGLEEFAAEPPGDEEQAIVMEEPAPEEPAAMEAMPPVSEEELAAMEALAEPAAAEAGAEEMGIPEEIELGETPEGLELEAMEEMPAAEAGPPSGEMLEALEGGEEEEYEFDEFSLKGLGEDFGISEEAVSEPPLEEIALPEAAAPAAEAEIELTEQQFSRLKRGLDYLPRNLKIIIEELIGEQELGGEELKKLVDALIRGAAPATVAAQVSAITGKRIVLPRRFEKKTGLAYEEERRRFAYRFRENILPILRVFVFSLLVLGLFAFLGYRYVYRPLYATTLYRRGYRQIEKERYILANQDFEKAARLQHFKHWYSRYARAFTQEKQFLLAEQKYTAMLELYPGDRQGTLGYADLESVYLENFEHADELLSRLLTEDLKDKEALLAQGDNFLRWAEEDPARYEDARFAYASIIDYYGMRDPVLLRMMRYFMRTDKLPEVRELKGLLEAKEKLKVEDELFADVYAELGGYLFDRGVMQDLPDPLFKAMDAKPDHPEVHYQLARYFKYVADPREEEKALDAAIGLLEDSPLSRRQRAQLIDVYNRLGHLNWRRGEYLAAEESYQRARAMIEEAQNRDIFGPNKDFGEVYKNLGDIYYYQDRNLDTAAALYRRAEENLYRDVDLDYKIGYISYMAGNYDEALLRFSRVVDERPRDENSLLSLANSLYERSDYFSAQGYYLHLLDLLETRKNSISFLRIQDNPEHRALMEYLMKAHNNLGVTLKNLAERTGDPGKNAQALVNLTFSSEYYDLISRDPETLKRGLTRNLAYLNQRGILYPQDGFALQIYNRLPVDLESRNF
jgi:tetratricopeptide (TPR) repeat protein